MDILVLSLVAGVVCMVGLWMASRDSVPPSTEATHAEGPDIVQQ